MKERAYVGNGRGNWSASFNVAEIGGLIGSGRDEVTGAAAIITTGLMEQCKKFGFYSVFQEANV